MKFKLRNLTWRRLKNFTQHMNRKIGRKIFCNLGVIILIVEFTPIYCIHIQIILRIGWNSRSSSCNWLFLVFYVNSTLFVFLRVQPITWEIVSSCVWWVSTNENPLFMILSSVLIISVWLNYFSLFLLSLL